MWIDTNKISVWFRGYQQIKLLTAAEAITTEGCMVSLHDVGKTFPCYRFFNPWHAAFIVRIIKLSFAIFVISQHWVDTGIGNYSSWNTGNCIFNIVDIMATDGLATWVARASLAMVLIYLSWDISTSALKGLIRITINGLLLIMLKPTAAQLCGTFRPGAKRWWFLKPSVSNSSAYI